MTGNGLAYPARRPTQSNPLSRESQHFEPLLPSLSLSAESSSSTLREMFERPMDARRRRMLIRSYAPDWIVTIVVGAIFIAISNVPGYKRQFSLDDKTLYHTYAVHERIPDVALYMICFVAPLVIQPIINLLTIKSWWDFHNSTLGLILGLALTGAVTQFVKMTVGRPRPDLIARCIPMAGAADPPYGLSSWTVCTQTDKAMMTDGWMSFPSGHSSMSFAGLGFLTFYICGKLHLFDGRGVAPKSWISLVPLAGASLVAISRTMDYRHHATDVIAGAFLGITVAYFSYRQYYPSLASVDAHKPYSPRIKREDILPTHTRNPSGASNPLAGQGPYTDGDALGEQFPDLATQTVPRDENGLAIELTKSDHIPSSGDLID